MSSARQYTLPSVRYLESSMRKTAIIAACFLFVSPLLVSSQTKQLSLQARKLSDALAELKAKPGDPKVQGQYLNIFPHDYVSFLGLFDQGQELADGFEYIMVLPSLFKNHEAETGRLLLQLSSSAHKEADAPTYLQITMANYAAQYTTTFANLLQQLPPAERINLITFLADVENHAVYGQYQEIIDHLRAIGLDDLSKEFERAREKRQQRHGR